MIGQKNPGGEQESLPRAHSVQRPRQDGEVLFVEVVVPRGAVSRSEKRTGRRGKDAATETRG